MTNYVIVKSSSPLEFWTGTQWTLMMEIANVYPTYGNAFQAIWALEEQEVTHKVTAVPKEEMIYLLATNETNELMRL